MGPIGLALIGAALALAGYFGRRMVEKTAETERLRRLSLALDVEQKLRNSGPLTVALMLLLLRRR